MSQYLGHAANLMNVAIVLFVAGFISYTVFRADAPVVADMSAQNMRHEHGVWLASVAGIKVRDCVFLPNETAGFATVDGVRRSVHFWFADDDTPGDTRPPGFQGFGTWAWDAPANATSVDVIVHHYCGHTRVDTRIGPFSTE